MPVRNSFPVARMAVCSLFVALTAICAQIIIPIGAVPVSLSLLPVLLCGALLSPTEAAASMTVYMVLGLVGVPVFAGFTGGPAALFGVTGGYILGYLPCAAVIALALHGGGKPWWMRALAMAAGILLCYTLGTAWFMRLTGRTAAESLGICVLPFLPFDAIKIALAVVLSARLERPLKRFCG